MHAGRVASLVTLSGGASAKSWVRRLMGMHSHENRGEELEREYNFFGEMLLSKKASKWSNRSRENIFLKLGDIIICLYAIRDL